jgi:membrane fusion protein
VQFRSTLVAPIGGTMASILVEPGQVVTAGTTLATIIPLDARLEAHLFTPSRSIGFVRDGQEVLLRFLAYPHQKFGSQRARVLAISKNPLAARGAGVFADRRQPRAGLSHQGSARFADDPRLRSAEPLQPGMQLEADILLDRRRLIEWIFEPLLSLAGRT